MGLRHAGFAILVLVGGCGHSEKHPAETHTAAPQAEWFVDRAGESGIDFVHVNGMSGQLYMPEILALAWRCSTTTTTAISTSTWCRAAGSIRPAGRNDRLYRNDLVVRADGTRTLHFTDVTAASGIEARGYGMGVATGDFDNDGWVDLYLTKFDAPESAASQQRQRHVHRRLEGERHRSSLVERVGVVRGRQSRRLARSLRRQLPALLASRATRGASSPSGALDYCTPTAIPPLPDRLYRNRRNGTFADVSDGVAHRRGSSVRRSASRPPTSTATDGWTSTSPTTARRTSCG